MPCPLAERKPSIHFGGTRHARHVHRFAIHMAAGTSNVSCNSGHNPVPSSGTVGIQSVYNQRFKAIATSEAGRSARPRC